MTEYLVFGGVALYLFVMDLLLNRKQEMTLTRAASWSIMYVVIAIAFAGYIWAHRGPVDAQLFLTAYILEKVLSVDNLMVFSAVFTYYGIRHQYRHRILHWGILGAAAMRLAFVYSGTVLFTWGERIMSLIFAFLIAWAGVSIIRGGADEPVDHRNRWYVRWLSRVFPVYVGPERDRTFTMKCINVAPTDDVWNKKWEKGKVYRAITPALLCLVTIEATDVVFAMDSVPTVIAVARDPFIVYSSMIFAIMGLRSMYFILEALQKMLPYLKYAVGMVLFFVAAKLILGVLGLHIPPLWSLGVVLVMLASGVVDSLIRGRDNGA